MGTARLRDIKGLPMDVLMHMSVLPPRGYLHWGRQVLLAAWQRATGGARAWAVHWVWGSELGLSSVSPSSREEMRSAGLAGRA